MKNPLPIIIFFTIYSLLNYWIGYRGWQLISHFIPYLNKKVYWTIFFIIAMSFVLSRIISRIGVPRLVIQVLTWVGNYWMVSLYYFILFGLAFELIRMLIVLPSFKGVGVAVVVFVISLLVYGNWNAQNIRLVRYKLTIEKQIADLQELKIVVLSDLHIGILDKQKNLIPLFDRVNNLKPDLILFIGDIIDSKLELLAELELQKFLTILQAQYGVFAVLGNHEYIGQNAEKIAQMLSESGITLLRDGYVKVADTFYLVGRDDVSRGHFGFNERKNLAQVMNGIDLSLPVLLMDHQPVNLAESKEQGVDLQISGHTHRGQFFPNNLITKKIFELDYGYKKIKDFQIVVSSGVRTWGPSVRICSVSEIVIINVSFC